MKITDEEKAAAAADLQVTAEKMKLSESAREKQAETTENSNPA